MCMPTSGFGEGTMLTWKDVEINEKVYELYGITQEEKQVIQTSLSEHAV